MYRSIGVVLGTIVFIIGMIIILGFMWAWLVGFINDETPKLPRWLHWLPVQVAAGVFPLRSYEGIRDAKIAKNDSYKIDGMTTLLAAAGMLMSSMFTMIAWPVVILISGVYGARYFRRTQKAIDVD